MKYTTVAFALTDDRVSAKIDKMAEKIQATLHREFPDLMIERLDNMKAWV